MIRYWKFFSYLIRHKWYVMLECFKYGLFWRGLVHDLDKFSPRIFLAFARYLYLPKGGTAPIRDVKGYYRPVNTGNPEMDRAWFLHQKFSQHHWQYWVQPVEGPRELVDDRLMVESHTLPMSDSAIIEMVCDFRGAGRALKSMDAWSWYCKNKYVIVMHECSRRKLETLLMANDVKLMKSYRVEDFKGG